MNITDCQNMLREALKAQGKYSPALEPTIMLVAMDYHDYLRSKNTASKEKSYRPVDKDNPEGRRQENPAWTISMKASSTALAGLRSLGLTSDKMTIAENSDIDNLTKLMEEA